jgi:endonuclease/exonuclease/phosphatase family metal-dependent hydrolase
MPGIRVMTLNIAGGLLTQDAGENAWEKRAPVNVQTIERYAPDLIGFQEVDAGNLEIYQQHLTEYEHVLGPATDEPDLPNYNAIYWKPDRLELVESGGFYLSRTPETWSLDWDAVCVRAATLVKLRTLEEGDRGKELLHLNTHLDHIGEQARQEGMGLIIHYLLGRNAEGCPILLTGDFNCNPWAPSYRISVETTFTDQCCHLVRAAGFVDTFLTAGGQDCEAAFTYHGFEGERYWAARHHMAGRIDWILTLNGESSLRIADYLVVRDHDGAVYRSDHYPVVADIVLTG